MRGINTVVISGNLARDPHLRSTSSGTIVLQITVAVNDTRKNKQTGEWEDYPSFIDCIMYGQRADSLSRFLSKGTYVSIQGKLHQNRWQTDEGQTRSKIEVNIQEIHFESKKHESDTEKPDLYDEDCPF